MVVHHALRPVREKAREVAISRSKRLNVFEHLREVKVVLLLVAGLCRRDRGWRLQLLLEVGDRGDLRL